MMARYIYGGGGDSEVNSPTTGLPYASLPATVYDSRVGGSVVTDIQDMSGGALVGIVTTDAFGQAIFQGPNNYTATLYLAFASGPRWAVNPKQIDQPNAGGQIIKDQRAVDFSSRTLTTKSALPTSANIPILGALTTALDPMVIPRFPSQATRDAAFPSPTDGDRCYRTDAHARQQYAGAVGTGRWITEPALIGEYVLAATTNGVVFTGIPQLWENLRLIVHGRCAASSQTHKYGVETFLAFNGDTTNTDYMFSGWNSLDKFAAGSATYGISTVDGTNGGATSFTMTSVAPNSTYLTRNGFAGDLGYRAGFLPGESTPTAMWGTIEAVISNYSQSTNGGGGQGIFSRSSAAVVAATSYSMAGEYRGAWNGTAAVTSLNVTTFTGALLAIGSTVRLYGF